MATFKNPANERPGLSVLAQGLLAYDRFEFDLSKPYAVGAGADESIIVIGYVPVDCVLVPQLTKLTIPQLDSNGAPTGDYYVGTLADTDALKGTAAAETATVLFGEDFLAPTAPVGSQAEATAIVIHVHNVIATLATTGKIVFEPVFRAWNPAIDG